MLTRRSVVLGAPMLVASAAQPHAFEGAGAKRAAVTSGLQKLIDTYAPAQLTGVSAAIMTRDGLFETSAGYADISSREHLRPADSIGIGSITKTFVAVVALQLVEAGRLNLQKTVLDALGPEASRGIANAGTATLAQLMGHTSGIPSWEDDPRWIHAARGDRIDPGHAWSKAETLNYIRGQPALFPPGEKYSYSNTNYTLLGLAIEQAAGRALTVEIRERILSPLQLKHTFLDGFSEPVDPTPRAHRYHHATPKFRATAGMPPVAREVWNGLIDVSATNLSCEWAAGGMLATSGDLVRFFRALRSGVLLNPASMAFMQVWRQAGTLPSGVPFFAGHGLFRQQAGGKWLIGHTGGVLGSTACAFWIEGEDVVFAVLSNIGTEHIGERKPNAPTVGQDPDFVTLASQLAR